MSQPITQARYADLTQIAHRFADEAQRAAALTQAVERRCHVLRMGGWVADAADEFLREFDAEILPASRRWHQAMNTAAATVHEIGALLQAAEEEAATQLRGDDGKVITSAGTYPAGGGGLVDFANTGNLTDEVDPTVAPEGVDFTTVGGEDSLSGIPEGDDQAQYDTIDGMSEDDLEDAGLPLETTDDYNSCGPLAMGYLINLLGGDVDAGGIFSDFVTANAAVAGFDPSEVTSMTELAPLAAAHGLEWTYNNRFDVTSITTDQFYTLVSEQVSNGTPLLALVTIDDSGVVTTGGGISHWVVITGVGTADDGTQYVQIYNPFNNQTEYYPAADLQSAFNPGWSTLNAFAPASDEEIAEGANQDPEQFEVPGA